MSYTFNKQERLTSKRTLSVLFSSGKKITYSPILLYYGLISKDTISQYPAQALFSVPKKRFKRAVDRNRIRRQMKEAYRLAKYNWYNTLLIHKGHQIGLAWVYIGKEKASFDQIKASVFSLLERVEVE